MAHWMDEDRLVWNFKLWRTKCIKASSKDKKNKNSNSVTGGMAQAVEGKKEGEREGRREKEKT
jgi:hypothetical protein